MTLAPKPHNVSSKFRGVSWVTLVVTLSHMQLWAHLVELFRFQLYFRIGLSNWLPASKPGHWNLCDGSLLIVNLAGSKTTRRQASWPVRTDYRGQVSGGGKSQLWAPPFRGLQSRTEGKGERELGTSVHLSLLLNCERDVMSQSSTSAVTSSP